MSYEKGSYAIPGIIKPKPLAFLMEATVRNARVVGLLSYEGYRIIPPPTI